MVLIPAAVVFDLGNVLIRWDPRPAIAAGVGDDEAARFLARVDGASESPIQLTMAKATGNFKRGNERTPGRP